MKDDSNRKLMFTLIGIVVFLLIIDVYQTIKAQNELQKVVTDFNAALNTLNDKLTDLDEQNIIFNNLLQSIRNENKENVDNLLNLIDQLESQTQVELEGLKDDITKVSVTSGDFSAIVEDVLQSVVSVATENGQGSGAFIASDGYIVTNEHVIEGANRILVLTYDGFVHNAELIGFDDFRDIAVLQIQNESFPYLRFADSDEVKVGEKVIAAGNPGGLDFTVTEGIVSANNRVISGQSYLQIDVPINPGNSGGPIVDASGKIVGIANFKIGGFEGLGFAIPSNTAQEAVQDII